jgi:hypothetical protein
MFSESSASALSSNKDQTSEFRQLRPVALQTPACNPAQ